MEKDLFVVLRRAYIAGSDEPSKWESIGYFESHTAANDSLMVGTGDAVKPHYNVGDLFVTMSVVYISDIENTETAVYIVSEDRNIVFTTYCFCLGSTSWFSGWEGEEADPEKLIDISIKNRIPIKEIVGILAECILASIPATRSVETDTAKFLASELLEFSRGKGINQSEWSGMLDRVSGNLYTPLMTVYMYRNEPASPGGYQHPFNTASRCILRSMPSSCNGRLVMVDIINKHIPLSRLLLASR